MFVSPRAVSPAGTSPRIHPPLGAISVLAEVRRMGYEAILIDSAAEGLKRNLLVPSYNPVTVEDVEGVSYWKTGFKIGETVSTVVEQHPDVIGISCCTLVDRKEASRLSSALKEACPQVPIIMGGHEASQWYREILGETSYENDSVPSVDYVVVGAGQGVFPKLLSFLEKKNNSDLPHGVACRSNGRVIYSDPDPFEPDLYALPDYSLLPKINVPGRQKPMDIYSYIGNPHAGRVSSFLGQSAKPISYLPLLTSYGCGFSCSFCDTDKKLVRYTAENAMKVIEDFGNLYGLDYIDFMDNNFGGGDELSRRIAFEILSCVAETDYQIGFSNGLTFESMSRENFRLLRQFAKNGNVRHLAFPCENGNDRVLRMIRKPHNLRMVNSVLLFATEHLTGTNREGFFIGGFPETNGQSAESPEEVEKTYQFMKQLLGQQLLHQAIFLTLSPVTREYRLRWRKLYPNAPFEHCLFSRRTGIWPYPSFILDEMHRKVKSLNQDLGRAVTRQL